MNVLGIDYQQTLSVLSLREGRGPSAPTTSVGDGRRILVPHAVTSAGTWGSDALASALETCYRPSEPIQEGPWLDSPAAELFWQGLYARLVSYLGRVKPTLANGYQTTIALLGRDWKTISSGVQRLCAQAGLGKNDSAGLREATCIPATEALLCRWLSAPSAFAPVIDPDSNRVSLRQRVSEDLPAEAVIAVIAVGDSSTLVGAYRVQRDHAGQWHISARPASLQHLVTGLSGWQAHLLTEVYSRFREEYGSDSSLEMRDSALDFAWQIAQSSADKELIWRGAGQERMYAPLCLTRSECAEWPQTQILRASLPPALTRAASALGKSVRVDRIVVGGVGALWPFAAEIANHVAPTWSSSTPQTDIAFGAAAWREFAGDALRLPASEIRIEAFGAASPLMPPASLPSPASTSILATAHPITEASPAPPPVSAQPVEKPNSAQTLPARTETLPTAEPPPAESKPPPQNRAPIDGEEWNAPEPGITPPWERE